MVSEGRACLVTDFKTSVELQPTQELGKREGGNREEGERRERGRGERGERGESEEERVYSLPGQVIIGSVPV